MKRREFIVLVGGVGATGTVRPLRAITQHAPRLWRIGLVLPRSRVAQELVVAFQEKLARVGYVDDKDIAISSRIVSPDPKSFEDAIQGLVPSIDLLVVWSTVGGVAAKRKAPSVPTIFISVGAPVNIGLVASLARPGGNMTGVTFESASETYGKRLQILKEIVPNLIRVAVLGALGDANVPFAMESIERAARELSVQFHAFDIASADDLQTAFAAMKRANVDGLIVIAGALTYDATSQIAKLAADNGLPSCHAFKEAVADGGLVSLGPDSLIMASQGAVYADKIIKGAAPGELPVEQPARYELHVNLNTAQTLGLTVPPSLIARADEVVE